MTFSGNNSTVNMHLCYTHHSAMFTTDFAESVRMKTNREHGQMMGVAETHTIPENALKRQNYFYVSQAQLALSLGILPQFCLLLRLINTAAIPHSCTSYGLNHQPKTTARWCNQVITAQNSQSNICGLLWWSLVKGFKIEI